MTYENYQGTCEVFVGERGAPGEPQCGRAATMRYPAMRGGYMRLCTEHGAKHASYCQRWTGYGWGEIGKEVEHA
jgi:hypothetical protein